MSGEIMTVVLERRERGRNKTNTKETWTKQRFCFLQREKAVLYTVKRQQLSQLKHKSLPLPLSNLVFMLKYALWLVCMSVMQPFSVSSGLCQTWWKGSHSRARPTKTKLDLRFSMLVTERWCLVYASHNGKRTETKTGIWKGHYIYVNVNICNQLEVHKKGEEVDKEIDGLISLLYL